MTLKAQPAKAKTQIEPKPNGRFLQTDAPSYSLAEAIRVAQAIADNFAYKPAPPLRVAAAMGIQPGAGAFRGLSAAAAAYGLTRGAWNASDIALTDLGLRVVRPLAEGDDLLAKRDALLTPRIPGAFLRKYDKAPFPKDSIAKNVLEDLGVPKDSTERVFKLIKESAELLGLVQRIKDQVYVDLGAIPPFASHLSTDPNGAGAEADSSPTLPPTALHANSAQAAESSNGTIKANGSLTAASPSRALNHRVFITHGKNRAFVEPIRQLLSFGGFEAVVSVERESVAQPVPDKVMEDMRSCGAAIIHVDAEQRLMDPEGQQQHFVLNSNVLIEIGAAMALYGRRFILLVKDGTKLPTNLHGLYEVRYAGESLDGDATIRLMKAINEMKNLSVPSPS